MKPTNTLILTLLLCSISFASFGQSSISDTPIFKDRDIEEVTPSRGTIDGTIAMDIVISAVPNPANEYTVVTIKGVRGSCSVSLKTTSDDIVTSYATGTVAGEDIILHIDLEKVETGIYIIEASSMGAVKRYPLAVIK